MTFDPDRDIPDLSGKVILVTGGNIGLGRESIYQLSKHNPSQIYLGARTKSKADATIAEIKSQVPNAKIEFLDLDLTSFESIKHAASTFNAKSPRLDILMNNAGIMAHPPGVTKEGYEIQFGTNHLGHALLTKLLLPKLKETAKEPNADVRIVNLSSAAHSWAPKGTYKFSELKTDMASTGTWARYGQSKVANIHYNRELARQNPDIKCVAVHPGGVNTNLATVPLNGYPIISGLLKAFSRMVTVPVQKGTLNQLWAATGKDVKTGVIYYPVALENKENAMAKDEKLSKALWEWTEEQLKGHA